MFMPVIVCIIFEEQMIAGVRFGTMIQTIIITLLLLELLGYGKAITTNTATTTVNITTAAAATTTTATNFG